jgi:hypothetical protein
MAPSGMALLSEMSVAYPNQEVLTEFRSLSFLLQLDSEFIDLEMFAVVSCQRGLDSSLQWNVWKVVKITNCGVVCFDVGQEACQPNFILEDLQKLERVRDYEVIEAHFLGRTSCQHRENMLSKHDCEIGLHEIPSAIVAAVSSAAKVDCTSTIRPVQVASGGLGRLQR